ncbi:MAG: hypothetical protein ACFNO7_07075, partial [Bacteroides sp.]
LNASAFIHSTPSDSGVTCAVRVLVIGNDSNRRPLGRWLGQSNRYWNAARLGAKKAPKTRIAR